MLRILGNSFEHFGNKGQYQIFIDTVLCRAELSNWDFAVLGTGTVSYTHLDVYKRQGVLK